MTDQRSGGQHQHGGQQGSTKPAGASEGTKDKNAVGNQNSSGGAEKRSGEDFSEKEQQQNQKAGDPENPSETTGGSESGGEDKGAKM